MANRDNVSRLKKGARAWNKWREANRTRPAPFLDVPSGIDLAHAELREFELAGAYLAGVDLQSADLRETDLSRANLRLAKLFMTDLRGAKVTFADVSEVDAYSANLSRANLRGADLRDARLHRTWLVGANLRGTDLRGAQFIGADLTRADLTNALLGGTVFGDALLRGTVGLDSCYHEAPSIVDYQTLMKSGELPVAFLREIGLSNYFIAQLPSILKNQSPLRCFISYAVEDERLVERIDSDLQRRDIRCWYFRKHAVVGRMLKQDIEETIDSYERVILVCSEAALTSPEVLKEVELAARKEDKTGEPVLVPITLDDYVFGDWRHRRKQRVVEKTICDFSGWRRASRYDASFEKPFRALHDSSPR